MAYTIGIDPDLHDLSIGVWGDEGPLDAFVVHLTRIKGQGREEAVDRMVLAADSALEGLEELWPWPDHLTVEGQSLKRQGAKQHRRPDDIVRLAQVAGQVLGICRHRFNGMECMMTMPDPETWKGGIAKYAHQARLYKELGWGYEIVSKGKPSAYSRPTNPPQKFKHITKGQWKHVGDALLLAKWAHETK